MPVRYITNIEDIPQLKGEIESLKKVTEIYPFRANDYYLSLINWDDPEDPIRKIVIPSPEELEEWGSWDPSSEKDYQKIQGMEHKYPDTVLLLTSLVCGGICRYCFRKRLFQRTGYQEILSQERLKEIIEYLKAHKEVKNVLLSGGDPLALSTPKLREIISQIADIPHIRTIRIGTKMVAYNPYRVIEDSELTEMIKTYSLPERRIYVITQFNHPRELTPQALEAIDLLIKSGAVLSNQSPILRGINDSPETLRELMLKLEAAGVPPYYFFINRPVKGTKHFSVPVEEAYLKLEKAKEGLSGLSRRARLIMSHRTGKIEIVGLTDEYIIMKYHRAASPEDHGKIMLFKRNPEGKWLEDFQLIKSFPLAGDTISATA